MDLGGAGLFVELLKLVFMTMMMMMIYKLYIHTYGDHPAVTPSYSIMGDTFYAN